MIRFTPRLESLDGRDMPSAGLALEVGGGADAGSAALPGDDGFGPPAWVTSSVSTPGGVVLGGLTGGVVLGGLTGGVVLGGLTGGVVLGGPDQLDADALTVEGRESDAGTLPLKASPKLFVKDPGEEIPS